MILRSRRLFVVTGAGLVAAVWLIGCNPQQHISAQSTQAVAQTVRTPPPSGRVTCQRLITSHVIDTKPVTLMKAVGGTVDGVRYWLRNRPGAARGALDGFRGSAHVTVCVYRGWFPAPVPAGVPVPTG